MALNDRTLVKNVITKAGIDGTHEAVTYKTVQEFAFGEQVVEEYLNYDTPEQRTRYYSYYTDIGENGYGKLESEVDFNGKWFHYFYDSAGRVIKEVSPFMDSPATAEDNQCVVITYDYAALESAEDVQTDDTRWRTKITLTLGIETAREYAQYFSDREKHITAAYAGAAFNDPANRIKTTYFVWYYDYQSVRKTRNTKVERPDGTSSEYSYVDSSRRVYTTGNSYVVYTTQKTTVNKFQGNITSRSIETTDQWGTVEYSRQYAPGEDGRELLVAGFDTTVDEYGRPVTTITVDGDVTRYEYPHLPLDGDTTANPVLYQHTRIIAPDGTVTLEYYDTWKRKTYTITNGIKTTYAYDANDNIIRKTITGRNGGMIESSDAYSADGQHLSHTDECGNGTLYVYGPAWETTADPLNHVRRTEYYLDGRVKKELFNGVVQKDYLYGVENGELFAKESLTGTEYTKIDTNFCGDEYRTSYGDNSVETTFFDSFARVARIQDSAGNVLQNEYSAVSGQLVKQTRNNIAALFRNGYRIKKGTIVSYQETLGYFNGNPIVLSSEETSRDAKSSWTFSYGKLSKTTKRYLLEDGQPTGITEEVMVDFDLSILTKRYINGVLTSSAHNVKGATTYEYDEFGRELASEHSENGHVVRTEYGYDACFRILTFTRSAAGMARTVAYTYDALGNRLSETTPLGITISYQYNEQGLITQISGGTYLQRYAYNAQNRLASLTVYKDADTPQVTTFEYDCRGRLVKKTYPDGNYEAYTYRGDGKILTAQNCRGQVTTYLYNAMGALSALQSENLHWDFIYDYRGMLLSASDGNIIHNMSYNAYGYLETENFSDISGTEIHYIYDGYMRRIAMTFDGEQVHYSYDTMNRLREINQNQAVFCYTRVPGSDALAKTDAIINGVYIHSAQKSYNPIGELTVADKYNYILDLDGKRTAASFEGKTWQYQYDGKNQVTSGVLADSAGILSSHAYAYDDMGNILPQQILRDADGNTLSVNDYEGGYDVLNRLISLTKDGVSHRLTYDYSSRLILIETYHGENMVSTKRFVYDGWNVIAEFVDGVKTKTWLWGEDLSGTIDGAGGVGGLLAENNDAGTFIPAYDGNGNIVSYLNEDGKAVANYVYDPFGNTILSNGLMKDIFDYKFSTKMSIEGLYYYGFRFYNPMNGVWLTRDPIGEQGSVNLYSFVRGNPISIIDKNGLLSWPCCGGEKYNPITHGCCDLGMKKQKYLHISKCCITGEATYNRWEMWSVRLCLGNMGYGPIPHAWVESGDKGYGFYTTEDKFGPLFSGGILNEETEYNKRKNGIYIFDSSKKTCIPVMLLKCKYDISKFNNCISSRKTAFYSVLINIPYLVGSCWGGAIDLLRICTVIARR